MEEIYYEWVEIITHAMESGIVTNTIAFELLNELSSRRWEILSTDNRDAKKIVYDILSQLPNINLCEEVK